MALTAKMDLNLNLTYTATKDLGTVTHTIALSRGKTYTNGTGANKAEIVFDDNRTLADAASETLDFQDGSLTDSLGTAVTIDIVRAVYIKNNSTEASLLVGGAVATVFGLFADDTDILKLRPGGEFFCTAPDATGIDITTNSDLKLEHDGTGTSSLTYDIIVVGED
ncbi:MAG: hypothetical protein PVJ86_00495 [Phycisphaerales bacterium]